MRRNQIAGNKNINRLITECDRRIQTHQILQLITAISCLLLKLPVCALNLRLIRIIQFSCRNLKCLAIKRIAVLAHHQQLSVICNCNNRRCSVVMNVIPVCLMSVCNHRILINLENVSGIFQLTILADYRRNLLCLFILHNLISSLPVFFILVRSCYFTCVIYVILLSYTSHSMHQMP